jgi:Ca-activated chloride channel family protein
MKRTALAFALLAWGFVASPAAFQTPAKQDPPPRATDAKTISISASVVDSKGNPVSGLTLEDFRVREDDVAREVLKVGPNTEPMQIALLVDDSQAATSAIQPIREGLMDFVDAMQGKGEIAIITVGERPTSVVQYTSSVEALKKGISRIFARRGSGAYLLEAITEASRGLQKRKATRPVIMAVTTEGVEFGSGYYKQILDNLYASGATFHVLALGTPAPGTTEEMRNRNMVIAEGTERTGGRRDQLLSTQAIPERLKQLATELTSQYLVTYSRPDTLIPPERVRVSVRNPNLTVRANTVAVAAK